MSHGGPVLQGQMVVGGEHHNGERGSEADGSSGWRWWSSEPPRLPIGCRAPARAGPPPGGFVARARAGVVGREGDMGVAAGASRASCTDSLSGLHQTSLEYGPHEDFSPRHQHCLWCFLYYCG
jgi:hypothetical protein